MTGAARLSSGLQPVTANAAPLWLSCTVDRRRQCVSTLAAAPSGMEARRVKSRRKPGSAQTENGTRRSVSIATPKAARGTECSDETG
jgi:hypothetical protein